MKIINMSKKIMLCALFILCISVNSNIYSYAETEEQWRQEAQERLRMKLQEGSGQPINKVVDGFSGILFGDSIDITKKKMSSKKGVKFVNQVNNKGIFELHYSGGELGETEPLKLNNWVFKFVNQKMALVIVLFVPNQDGIVSKLDKKLQEKYGKPTYLNGNAFMERYTNKNKAIPYSIYKFINPAREINTIFLNEDILLSYSDTKSVELINKQNADKDF